MCYLSIFRQLREQLKNTRWTPWGHPRFTWHQTLDLSSAFFFSSFQSWSLSFNTLSVTVIGEFRFQTGRFAVWKHIPPFNVSILMIGDMNSRTEEAFFTAALKPCKPKAYLCKKVRKVSVFTETKPFKIFSETAKTGPKGAWPSEENLHL